MNADKLQKAPIPRRQKQPRPDPYNTTSPKYLPIDQHLQRSTYKNEDLSFCGQGGSAELVTAKKNTTSAGCVSVVLEYKFAGAGLGAVRSAHCREAAAHPRTRHEIRSSACGRGWIVELPSCNCIFDDATKRFLYYRTVKVT